MEGLSPETHLRKNKDFLVFLKSRFAAALHFRLAFVRHQVE